MGKEKQVDSRLSDRWWRLNNLYYIINEQGHKVKFKPCNRAVQTELYNNLWYLNTVLKARQHGVTTFFCIFFLDACLFKSNIRAGIIAHNKEDAQTFFQDKVKYAYDNIEFPELKKLRSAGTDTARELKFSNNSAIRVGTSLRSATLQYLLISEYGKICAKYPEKAKEIRTGALNTVHAGQFIAIESTAEGRDGHFYQLDKLARDYKRSGLELTEMDFKHFFFSWFKKPEYSISPEGVDIPIEMEEYFTELKDKHDIVLSSGQKAWYVKKYETQQDEMKREFPSTEDEAFEAAIIGAYYSRQMAKAREQKRLLKIPHNPSALVHTAWDLGLDDSMSIWLFQMNDDFVDIIGYYENSGEDMPFYVSYLRGLGYEYGSHFAPHDIAKRDLLTNKNRIVRAKEMGINFDKIERCTGIIDDINEVRRIFYRLRFCTTKAQKGINALDNYRKAWNDKLGCFHNRPLHNWASHGSDALRTLVHGIERVQEGKVKSKPLFFRNPWSKAS